MKTINPIRDVINRIDGPRCIIRALGRDWSWDINDTECWPVVFGWSPDIKELIDRHFVTRQMRSVVQAGGNFGVWPWLLSHFFDTIYTYEPDPRCFRHLVRNCGSRANIVFNQAALGDERQMVRLMNLPGEETNIGAQYVAHDSGAYVPTYRIDDLGLTDCDLIYLDIEGAELPALQGGQFTIARCKPVIVVEDKGLSDKFGYKKGDIAKWLAGFGYEAVDLLHRDVVLVAR